MGIGAIGDAIGGLLGGGGGGTLVEGVAPTVNRKIVVDGRTLPEAVEEMIESVVVQDRLRMPDSFVITFHDPRHDAISRSGLKIGSKVKISAGAPGVETPDELMVGQVTSIETEYDRLGTRATVRGYDALHRLSAGTKSRTWENVSYSDIVRKIAREAGLSVDMDMTSGQLEHVIQPNVSDLHFIYYLAGRCGYTVAVKDQKLLFKEPTKASEGPSAGTDDSMNPLQLVWGQRLIEFHARISAVGQVADVQVRGWDQKTQKALIGKSRSGASSANVTTSISKLTQTSKGKTYTVVDQPMATQAHADRLAKAVAEQIGSAAYEATALVVGSPKLKSGVAVTISGVDEDVAGKWVITSARHEFGNGPYRTFLEFSGRQDRSILGLTAGAGSPDAARSIFPGVVTAVVTDIKDPDKLGRVKIEYEWLGEKMQSNWARVARPSAGRDYGILWFPDVREEVLVAFEHGDINYPIVIGSLWNAKAKPPAALVDAIEGGRFLNHALASPGGQKIVLYDKDSDAGIQLVTKDQKVKIMLGQGSKTMELFLDGKELTITSKGDLKLTADGAITIDSKKKVEIKGQSGVDISASSGNTTVKGMKVAIN